MKKVKDIAASSTTERGITLIEIILVVSIILILGTGVSAFGTGFLARNSFRNTTNVLVSALRIAQLNSISSREGLIWGVEVTAGDIRMFAVGDSTYDQLTKIPSGISITAGSVTFDNLTGSSDSPITFSLSNSLGEVVDISVNEVGVADVN